MLYDELDLDNSPEPLRIVYRIVSGLILLVGTVLATIVGAWPAAPEWMAPAAVVLMALSAQFAMRKAVETARSVVTPGPHVAALLASSEPYVEPWDIDLTDDLSDPDHADSDRIANPADEPVDTAALDAAAEAAGLA